MTQYTIEPVGWPCTLEECPPGFFMWNENLCFKTEYRRDDGLVEAFNEAGEFFAVHDAPTLIVQPVIMQKRSQS